MPSFEIQADIFTRLSVFDSPEGSSNTFKTHKNISLYFKRRYLIIYNYFLFCLITVLQKIIVTDTPSDKVSIKTRPTQQSQECTSMQLLKGHFPPGGIFREERHFLMFEDQLAESGRQKTKENIIPCGKFRLEENDLNSLK